LKPAENEESEIRVVLVRRGVGSGEGDVTHVEDGVDSVGEVGALVPGDPHQGS